MSTYVWKDGSGFVDKQTGERMALPTRWQPTTPMIIRDIPAHLAPGGVYVGGRSAQRELEKTHNLIPYERVGHMRSAPTTTYDSKCERWQQWSRDRREEVKRKTKIDPATQAAVATALKASKRP